MILHTELIEPRSDYRLFVRFNNGVSGEINLAEELWGEMFESLKDPALFATAAKTTIWAQWFGPMAPILRLNCY